MRDRQPPTDKKLHRLQPKKERQSQTPVAQEGILPPQHNPLTPVISSVEAHAAMLNRTMASSPSQAQESLLQLQRQYGNRYVQRLIATARQSKEKTKETFALEQWFKKFRDAATFTLSRFYIGTDSKGVRIKQQDTFAPKTDDKRHPAYYNPNDRSIYFSSFGFQWIYQDRVLKNKIWKESDYENFVIETAIEEAFHAYQDSPRFRSKKLAQFLEKIKPKVRKELSSGIELGMIETHDDFFKLAQLMTAQYLEPRIKEFIGENLPGFHRDPKWQFSARQEIINQWLHFLEDLYFRTRSMEYSYRKNVPEEYRKGTRKKPLRKEKREEVSIIEKQARKFAKMKVKEVKILLLVRELETESDIKKQIKLKTQIEKLKEEIDLKKITELEKRKKQLEEKFSKLDANKKEDLDKSIEIAQEVSALQDKLDVLISLRDGIEAVFRKKGFLIGK